jgi:allophanate hydrolase subunit 2
MHEGVPWSGPMVPELFVRANRAVHNADDAVAIEVHGSLEIRAISAIEVGDERGQVTRVSAGDRFVLASDPTLRVRYLALRGGVNAPLALGSRTTLHGVMGGAARGDALSKNTELVAGDSKGDVSTIEWPLHDGPIVLVPGPDADLFVNGIEALARHDYDIHPTSNRAGTRLRGPSLVVRTLNDARPSMPMVLGAIQVPPNGMPIVLGPDHPTTGGYPVAAVIAREDIGRFHATPIGARVRFALQSALS